MKDYARNAITTLALLCGASAVYGETFLDTRAGPDEKAFLLANDQVMTKMMEDMTREPSGDVDHDFVTMMVPHHQGAMDMAQLELLYGRNEQLRRIAQEIIVEQQQEIVAMRLALGQTLPLLTPAPDQSVPSVPTTAAANDHAVQEKK